MHIKPGTFVGIGVGPGDPDLMTVKAIKAMNAVDVIFAAGHKRSGVSIAAEIARPHLLPGKEVVQLNFPHTFDSVEGREPHREAAEIIASTLKKPASAAFLTLGDPMTFSTFTYVRDEVLKLFPEAAIEVVPGVTSFAAAAAAIGVPLAEGEETFAVTGAAREIGGIAGLLESADNLVIMKPYRMTDKVCEIIEERGLSESTWFCTECSRPTQKISRGLEGARNAGPEKYMSLFIVRKKKG